MPWTTVSFGKHKGKTLPQIVLSDPDYFFWAYEERVFKGLLSHEADEINRRACSIRIPNDPEDEKEVEYILHPSSMTFATFEVVPKDRPVHEGSSPAYRDNVIDLSYPRKFKSYDKLGCSLLLHAFKFHVFGDTKKRLTRSTCEAFFDEDSNFVLCDRYIPKTFENGLNYSNCKGSLDYHEREKRRSTGGLLDPDKLVFKFKE